MGAAARAGGALSRGRAGLAAWTADRRRAVPPPGEAGRRRRRPLGSAASPRDAAGAFAPTHAGLGCDRQQPVNLPAQNYDNSPIRPRCTLQTAEPETGGRQPPRVASNAALGGPLAIRLPSRRRHRPRGRCVRRRGCDRLVKAPCTGVQGGERRDRRDPERNPIPGRLGLAASYPGASKSAAASLASAPSIVQARPCGACGARAGCPPTRDVDALAGLAIGPPTSPRSAGSEAARRRRLPIVGKGGRGGAIIETRPGDRAAEGPLDTLRGAPKGPPYGELIHPLPELPPGVARALVEAIRPRIAGHEVQAKLLALDFDGPHVRPAGVRIV
ncbi:MAG: hypothetical protein QOK40_402 [Miltoncostaeaceae bacterium]|nr:hypothetical protein [Miltoncostaeaceae bacterium]